MTREPAYVVRLRGLAHELGVQDSVHFLGFRSDVAQLLPDADVFLHSAIADPHPRAVIEAMASGLPVVAFAADGVAETVADGETGRLVETGDAGSMASAVIDLARSPDARKRMSVAGRDRAESRFAAETTNRNVAKVIGEVLEGRKISPLTTRKRSIKT